VNTRRAEQKTQLLSLSIVALGVLVLAGLVQGLGPPFAYRLGQRPAREIRVAVDQFQRRDPVKTNADKRAVIEKIAPLLSNESAAIRELSEQLGDLVVAIAKAPTRVDLPVSRTSGWNLDTGTFEDIRAAADTPERREKLLRQIETAFGPVIENGVLGPDTLPREEEFHATVRIQGPAGADAPPRTLPKDRVLAERITRTDGPVARDFAAVFTPPRLGERLFYLITERLKGTPTLRYEDQATDREREAAVALVPDAVRTYRKGVVLVGQDEPITEDHLQLLRLEHARMLELMSWPERLGRLGSMAILLLGLVGLLGWSLVREAPQFLSEPRRVLGLVSIIVGAIVLVRLVASQPWDAEIVPVTLVGMILAIAYSRHFALIVSFGLCLMTSLTLGLGLGHFVILMGGTAAAVLTLGEVRTRAKPIQVGAIAGATYFLLTWAIGLFQNQPIPLIVSDSLWRGGWGLMSGFVLGGILPFIENAFGIVTGISLLELGDINHPLLQELVRRAPGTHNHSITVGTLAEAAAKRIGANGLLVRIGAYFHDIGKMLKPHYFVENQNGAVSRHANLAPAMSTLIIIGHVKDGVDLGRNHHLPQPILDLIAQHHGTTLVEYFYHEATRRSDGDPDQPAVLESAFRYPGPKPQTREAAVLMVADAVESASRTLSEPTPARIDSLVGELIQKRLDDGQFDECALTLGELAEIRDSLTKSLIGIYHGRVKYPEQRTA
jgi:putative nucleotidyltransferase with HDIG domain